MKRQPRIIAAKVLLRPDEFTVMQAACNTVDVPMSRVLRDLGNWWSAWVNINGAPPRLEVAKHAPNVAMFSGFPGGSGYPLRL